MKIFFHKHKFIINLISSFQLVRTKSTQKQVSVMSATRTAYFHLADDCDKFKVSFFYANESVNVNRQFNFERSTAETVQCFLARVSTNLEKFVMKKVNKKRKKSDGKEDLNIKVDVELLSNGSTVPDTASCKDVFFTNGGHESSGALILRMIGIDYIVAINSPWIDSISLPSSVMAGFPVYTNCFESKFTDKSLSTFIWMKSLFKIDDTSSKEGTKPQSVNNDSENWQVVGEGFIYLPSNLDVGHKLKVQCTPRNSAKEGPASECESKSVVEAGPGHCPFENRHMYTQMKTPLNSFRVISYNILADVYSSTDEAQNNLFSYCPSYALDIDYRKQLFLKELLGYNGDLVCLQEVDTKVFETDLVPVLGEQGVLGVHVKKSTVNEGVAVFYSSSKFKLIDVQEVFLKDELLNKKYCSHILESVMKNEQLKARITSLGSAALGLVLESLERPGELLVVGNTHLYFHPDADHIRLLQGAILIAFLSDIVCSVKNQNPTKEVSLVCCGDFNSVPECGIYKLLTTRSVSADFIDWKSKPGEEVTDLSLSQPFIMESACGTPKYTNYTVGFADCLDYIYYQTDRLRVDAVVPMPTDSELQEHKAIPSVVFPSDHLALVADLSWRL